MAVALIELAVEFGVQNHRGVVLGIVPTHKQLADLVGASRPKVSEIMNDLQRRKALSRDGRKLTLAVKRLESIVTSGAMAMAISPRLELQVPLVGPVLVAELVPCR